MTVWEPEIPISHVALRQSSAAVKADAVVQLLPSGRRYWTLSEAKPQHWEVLQQPLPSDIRYRQDLAALAAGNLDQAQHYKEVLERQQRSDRKLREAAGVFEH